ncbi:type VII secretion target [Streptomyces luteireticuli]|uniref:WXG100 family type VII secretion target n=1 Tax=Streptomyces luteireticuli TaxID=173858 RepID=A0ABN0YY89_9ACTN
MDISIKTDYVRLGAGGTQTAAETALENLRRSLDSSETAADDHYGWASAAALKQCAIAWENHMVDLAKQMNTMGEKLHSSANDYDTTDLQAKDALNRIQHGLTDLGRN